MATAVAVAEGGRERVALRGNLLGGDDVEDARHAFRIVLCTRIGDDFNLLDSRGGITLKDKRRIGRHHLIGLAVDINLESLAALHLNLIVALNRDHRHLAKHFQERVGLSLGVVGHGIGHLIYFRFHERALGGDGGRGQGVADLLQEKIVKGHGRLAVHLDRAAQGLFANHNTFHAIGARFGQRQAEAAIGIGGHGSQWLGGAIGHDADGGVGLGATGQGVPDRALKRDGLRILCVSDGGGTGQSGHREDTFHHFSLRCFCEGLAGYCLPSPLMVLTDRWLVCNGLPATFYAFEVLVSACSAS